MSYDDVHDILFKICKASENEVKPFINQFNTLMEFVDPQVISEIFSQQNDEYLHEFVLRTAKT